MSLQNPTKRIPEDESTANPATPVDVLNKLPPLTVERENRGLPAGPSTHEVPGSSFDIPAADGATTALAVHEPISLPPIKEETEEHKNPGPPTNLTWNRQEAWNRPSSSARPPAPAPSGRPYNLPLGLQPLTRFRSQGGQNAEPENQKTHPSRREVRFVSPATANRFPSYAGDSPFAKSDPALSLQQGDQHQSHPDNAQNPALEASQTQSPAARTPQNAPGAALVPATNGAWPGFASPVGFQPFAQSVWPATTPEQTNSSSFNDVPAPTTWPTVRPGQMNSSPFSVPTPRTWPGVIPEHMNSSPYSVLTSASAPGQPRQPWDAHYNSTPAPWSAMSPDNMRMPPVIPAQLPLGFQPTIPSNLPNYPSFPHGIYSDGSSETPFVSVNPFSMSPMVVDPEVIPKPASDSSSSSGSIQSGKILPSPATSSQHLPQPVLGSPQLPLPPLWLTRIRPVIPIIFVKIPQQIYLNFLLRLPLLYFSRVSRLLEDANLSLPDIQRMAVATADQWKDGTPSSLWPSWHGQYSDGPVAPKLLNFRHSWEGFIDSLLREWKTQNVVSALMLSAILTMLQIGETATDPVTRTTALMSLICALMSLLFGSIYIIRFGTMRKMYKASMWAEEARKGSTALLWNVWILLAIPAVWLAWSIILFVTCIMAFVWRTGGSENVLSTPPATRNLRIGISAVLVLALAYLLLIVATFQKYGETMDGRWKELVLGWTQEKAKPATSSSSSSSLPFIPPLRTPPSGPTISSGSSIPFIPPLPSPEISPGSSTAARLSVNTMRDGATLPSLSQFSARTQNSTFANSGIFADAPERTPFVTPFILPSDTPPFSPANSLLPLPADGVSIEEPEAQHGITALHSGSLSLLSPPSSQTPHHILTNDGYFTPASEQHYPVSEPLFDPFKHQESALRSRGDGGFNPHDSGLLVGTRTSFEGPLQRTADQRMTSFPAFKVLDIHGGVSSDPSPFPLHILHGRDVLDSDWSEFIGNLQVTGDGIDDKALLFSVDETDSIEPLKRVATVVHLWNKSFFGPRFMEAVLVTEDTISGISTHAVYLLGSGSIGPLPTLDERIYESVVIIRMHGHPEHRQFSTQIEISPHAVASRESRKLLENRGYIRLVPPLPRHEFSPFPSVKIIEGLGSNIPRIFPLPRLFDNRDIFEMDWSQLTQDLQYLWDVKPETKPSSPSHLVPYEPLHETTRTINLWNREFFSPRSLEAVLSMEEDGSYSVRLLHSDHNGPRSAEDDSEREQRSTIAINYSHGESSKIKIFMETETADEEGDLQEVSFSRPLEELPSDTSQLFLPMKIMDLGDCANIQRWSSFLISWDILEGDWSHFIHSLQDVWSGKDRRIAPFPHVPGDVVGSVKWVAGLIHLWNINFFLPRSTEAVICKENAIRNGLSTYSVHLLHSKLLGPMPTTNEKPHHSLTVIRLHEDPDRGLLTTRIKLGSPSEGLQREAYEGESNTPAVVSSVGGPTPPQDHLEEDIPASPSLPSVPLPASP